jgi:hypothetical protein
MVSRGGVPRERKPVIRDDDDDDSDFRKTWLRNN